MIANAEQYVRGLPLGMSQFGEFVLKVANSTPQNPLTYSRSLSTGVAMIQSDIAGSTIATALPCHIYIPAGTHVLSSPITITRHNVTLTVDGGAKIVPPPNQSAIVFDPTGTPEGYIKHWQLFLLGMIWGAGSGANEHGVLFNHCIHGTAHINEIRALGGSGMVFDGSCFSNHIAFNRIVGCSGWAIQSTGANNHNANILTGEMQGCTLGGANLLQWTDSIVTLRAENFSGGVTGIKLDSARGIQLSAYFENPINTTGDDILTAATSTRCEDIVIDAPTRFNENKTGSAYNINVASNTTDRLEIRSVGVNNATTRILNVGAGNTKIHLHEAADIPMAGVTNAAGGDLRVGSYVLAQSAVQVTAPADTAFNSLATITVPAGALGNNGMLEVLSSWSVTNNANAKLAGVRLNGSTGTVIHQDSVASVVSSTQFAVMANRNSASVQVMGNPNTSGGLGVSATGGNTDSVNTNNSFTINLVGQKAVGSDTLSLEMYKVIIYPRP